MQDVRAKDSIKSGPVKICGQVWVKADDRRVVMCYLPEGHPEGCRGTQIGSDGKRWPRSEWPIEVRSGFHK
jgi:hypothetical protein